MIPKAIRQKLTMDLVHPTLKYANQIDKRELSGKAAASS